MITPTKRFPLPSYAKPLTEDERYDACYNIEHDDFTDGWEATVRHREDELIVAEAKLSKTIQELHAAKAKIERLERQLSGFLGAA